MLSSIISSLSKCFFSSNSFIFLFISVGDLVPVPLSYIVSLLDRSMSSSFLMRGARSTPFFQFTTTYCSTHSCNFRKLSLSFVSLVPSTVPTSDTLPLKVFGIPDFFFFLVAFMCLLPPFRPSLSWSWFDCWFYLRAWVCGPLVSPRSFYRMLPLGVSCWGSYFLSP